MNMNKFSLDNILETECDQYTEMNYPYYKTINEIFEEQVKRTPNSYALVFEEKKLTYEELNKKSNFLASVLTDNGVEKNSVVGIVCEKSFEMIIGILGVLKAGAAFLIIDPEYPENRVKFALENSNVRLLLIQSTIKSNIPFEGKKIVFAEEDLSDVGTYNLVNKSDDLAFVIYTSGSTGNPKGAMIRHRNIVNTAYYLHSKVKADSSNKVLQFFSPSFSVCYQEIFISLLFGEELHIINKNTRDNIGLLLDYINKMQLNVLFLPTSYIKAISKEKKILQRIPDSIKYIIAAGEQLVVSDEFIKCLQDKNTVLYNSYGTSETNTVTLFSMNENNTSYIPPIGKPVANTHVYILDENFNMRPAGCEGELFVSGDSVGMGYINNPDLTSERFIQNPFLKDKLMYRTGDLAKFLPDGNIDFLGRADFQVKIRGFRVEVGEIEYHLLKHDSVKEAVVVAKERDSNNRCLYAYIIVRQKVSINEIRKYLNKKLPEYMVPAYIIELDEFPKLPTGKINRKALIELEHVSVNESEQNNTVYDGVSNYSIISAKIKDIIRNIDTSNPLSRDISENDSFNDCAIDSLTFIRLVSKVQNEFKIEFDNMYLNISKFNDIESFISYVENKVNNII